MLRLPAVAGTFYPAEPAALTALLRQCLSVDSAVRPAAAKYRACLVPHAGYVYSGPVAGKVFSRIQFPVRIIILGVRHFPYGAEAAIFPTGAWRTPLGDIPIDSALAAEILHASPILHEDHLAHESEHSLEVQLPFLQLLAPAAKIVPIAIGSLPYDDLVHLGHSLGQILSDNPDVFLLTTTDLNHYEDLATTRRKDQFAIDQILVLNPSELFQSCRRQKISMCGLGSTVAMLAALNSLGAKNPELVSHTTSADYSGDTKRVVGYAGFLFP
ncbi:MAG TPA: AmmeMemoRadiSam system protein B [Candidatus Acidoferrum sp.]|nr:AmmeMemoRadiSam system protein B [Candidatus Acidoferrum sp.]